MSNSLSTMSILALSVMGMFAPTVKADEWDKKTNITINQAIEVEGTVLRAGSYVLKLVDSPSNRNLVFDLERRREPPYRDCVHYPDLPVSAPGQQRVQVLRIRSRATARTSCLVLPW